MKNQRIRREKHRIYIYNFSVQHALCCVIILLEDARCGVILLQCGTRALCKLCGLKRIDLIYVMVKEHTRHGRKVEVN